jgi:hypothetical protein
MLVETLDRGGGQLRGRVKRAEQGQSLATEGIGDQRELGQIPLAQHRLESLGFGVDVALASWGARL